MEAKSPNHLDALTAILGLLGTVDHATKTGANDALYRGQLLNDIRAIARMAVVSPLPIAA
jgi:hypothetical protein